MFRPRPLHKWIPSSLPHNIKKKYFQERSKLTFYQKKKEKRDQIGVGKLDDYIKIPKSFGPLLYIRSKQQ